MVTTDTTQNIVASTVQCTSLPEHASMSERRLRLVVYTTRKRARKADREEDGICTSYLFIPLQLLDKIAENLCFCAQTGRIFAFGVQRHCKLFISDRSFPVPGQRELWGCRSWGELSSARQALVATVMRRRGLSDETKSPGQRHPLEDEWFLLWSWSAKQRSAGGPSGMTVEVALRKGGVCTALLGDVATQSARGQLPEEVFASGEIQKPDGAEYCGWRCVSAVVELSPNNSPTKFRGATHPFHCALSTRRHGTCATCAAGHGRSNFGQNQVWPSCFNHLWPTPTLANPTLAKR